MSAARRLALGAVLALTLALAAWVEQESGSDPPPADPRPEREPAAAGRALPDLQGRRSSPAMAGGMDLFPPQSWNPPPALAAAPPEPPRAPALPFAYGGKLVEDARVTVYLSADERNFVVRAGDVIEGGWLLKAVTPDSLTFVYLPLQQEQSLSIGSSN